MLGKVKLGKVRFTFSSRQFGLLFSQENLVYFFREGSSHWLNFVGLLFSGLLPRDTD